MENRDQVKMVQDYVNMMGKAYVIMLSTLDEYFGDSLSINEKVILQVLDETPISMSEISVRTGMLLTTLTSVIDKMEEKRLVRRRPSSTDRRKVEIELAVAGTHIKEKFNDLIAQLSSTFLAFLSDKDREDFAEMLDKIIKILAAEADSVRDRFGSLIEPLKTTLENQFKIED